jgi:hypothetical protein
VWSTAKPTSGLAWNTDLDKRPISQRYLVSSGKRYEDLNEFEEKILADMEASNQSFLKKHPMVTGGVIVSDA